MSRHSDGFTRSGPAVRAFAVAAALAGVAWLLAATLRQTVVQTDFRYVWLAGHLWREGVDPYGAAFSATGHVFFPEDNGLTPWYYPFHWYAPASAAALLGPAEAFRLWTLASVPVVLAAAWLTWRVARGAGCRVAPAAGLLLLGYALTTTLLTAAVRTGQPAVPAVAGLPLAAWGLLHGRRWGIAAGTVLLLLKPQLGVPCVAALALLPGALAGVLAGGAAVALLSVPAFLTGDGLHALSAFLANARGGHAVIEYNLPADMTGLAHLLDPLGLRLTLFTSLLLATAIVLALTLWRRLRPIDRAEAARFLLIVPPLCVGAIVSLHLYDLMLLLPALPLLAGASRRAQLAAGAGLLVLWRPENVTQPFGATATLVASLGTAGALLLCLAWTIAWRDAARAR